MLNYYFFFRPKKVLNQKEDKNLMSQDLNWLLIFKNSNKCFYKWGRSYPMQFLQVPVVFWGTYWSSLSWRQDAEQGATGNANSCNPS